MKQVLQDRNGSTAVREVPPPACPEGGVLVRNRFSAISSGTERSRVEVSRKSLLGKARERPDLVRQVIDKAMTEGIRATRAAVSNKLSAETAVGYSSVGEIVEMGPGARGFEVGNLVACCGGGHANHAEICAMPANLVAKVPDGVPLPTASIATIGAIALHGVRLTEVTLGETVAVIGAGLVGQIACRLLRSQGAEVIAIDVDESRTDYAVAHGADHGVLAGASAGDRVRTLTDGIGADRVLVCAAAKDPEPLRLGAEIARDRGSLILVGAVPVDLPRAPLYDKELVFRISRSYGPGRYDLEYEERGLDYPIGFVRWTEQRNLEAVMQLQARGQLNLDDLVDEIVPVAEAGAAYERLVDEDHSRRPLGAIVLSYGENDDHPEPKRPGIESREAESPGAETLNDAPRIALVGPGGFASRILVPAFSEAGAILELAGGGSGPSAEAAVREKGFARVAGSESEAVTDGTVDAVVIATRHGSHARLSEQALKAGKHVFCEKPLALNVGDLDRVIDAASGSKRVLAVGYNRRFAPMVVAAREHLAAIGGPTTATYRVNAGQMSDDHWVHDPEQGGGRLLGEACHFIDTLAYLVGSPVTTVTATSHGPRERPLVAHDCALISLGFADGSIGQVAYVSQGSPRIPKERIEVFGNGGRAAVLEDFRSLELFDGSRVTKKTSKSQDKGHRAEVAAFVDAVRGRGEAIPLTEVANSSYATLAVIRSLESGQPVDLTRTPPDQTA